MRHLSGVIAALLLALLTWLLLRGIDTNAESYAATLRAFDDLALAEASLHRDILQARAGLLRNYDSLVAASNRMVDAVTRLHAYAVREGFDTGPADRMGAAVARQEELAERFKSSNAVLQNSLSYVGLLSTRPEFGTHDAKLAPSASALAAAILNLTRDTTPEAINLLQDRINRFATQTPPEASEAEAARALLAHARLLRELLPAIDQTLKAFIALSSKQSQDEMRAQFSQHQSEVEAMAWRFRLALYLVSIMLLVALVYFGLQLRARAVALRQRAAFDHVIAENSTRLIKCEPEEIDALLEQVLGDLCRTIGAQRAYVVLDGKSVRVHTWCVNGEVWPQGWPNRALQVSRRLGTESSIIAVPNVSALPPGESKDILASAGITAWTCVPLIQPDRVRGLLGFDGNSSASTTALPHAVLRLAGDAVANALERELLQQDRLRLSTRLERTRRIQIIGSMASGIAHNFNNIIGAILGYSEMLEPQLARGSKPAEHVDEIRRAAERGRDIIEKILTFGRRRDGRRLVVQVSALLDESASLLRASLPAGMQLVIDNVSADLAVSGELAQLQQVILNLCANAAQAMDGSGRICVIAEQKHADAMIELSHGELTPGRYVCLAVLDSGHGFEQAVAERLFEPFFTTRSGGTGLGLATVLEIVRAHDGAMNVRSNPGRGSCFEAWLPAAGGPADIGSVLVTLGRGETVLVVESEVDQLLRNEDMLAALGYEPVGFERPDDALAACRSAPNRFDVLLVSAAVDVARALHKIAPRQPLLLATASTMDESVSALAEAGISEVLRRPLTSSELAAALTRCLPSSDRLQT